MNPMIRNLLSSFSLCLFCLATVFAQDSTRTKPGKKQAAQLALKKAVDNRRYYFLAQNALPTGGRNRILTTPYSLALLGDTLDADLPYFGRAFTADYGSTDNGIRFRTTDFTYTVHSAKKGGWEIVIIPKNQPSASKIYLNIGATGYSTLNVQSNNRQNIAFYGTVSPDKRQ